MTVKTDEQVAPSGIKIFRTNRINTTDDSKTDELVAFSLWFGTKNNFVPSKRPVFIAFLSRSSYTRKFIRKLDCSRACLALTGEISSAKMEPKKTKKFYSFPVPEKN